MRRDRAQRSMMHKIVVLSILVSIQKRGRPTMRWAPLLQIAAVPLTWMALASANESSNSQQQPRGEPAQRKAQPPREDDRPPPPRRGEADRDNDQLPPPPPGGDRPD